MNGSRRGRTRPATSWEGAGPGLLAAMTAPPASRSRLGGDGAVIRIRLVAGDLAELHAAADQVAIVLTVVGGRGRARARRAGGGHSLYLDVELPSPPARTPVRSS